MPETNFTDIAMMRRCIELSRTATKEGEYPFGTVIALDGRPVAEAINRTRRDGDVTRHAEIIALSEAQKTLSREDLCRATLYTNVEPCAMCSYCIREAWIGRVVYSLSSPVMGGHSKWNILRDDHISKRVPIFGPIPEVVSGLMMREVQQAWKAWHPIGWELVKLRGVLANGPREEALHVHPKHPRSAWHRIFLWAGRQTKRQSRKVEEIGDSPVV